MKKLITKLALALIVSVTFISCSKDDEPTNSASPSIIDDWTYEKYGSYDEDSNTVNEEINWVSDCSTKKDYFLLTNSNNFTFNWFSSACEATFFAQENGSFTFNDENDRLTISGGTDWDGVYAVKTLTQTDLVLVRIPQTIGKTNFKLPSYNYYKFSRRN